MGCDVFSGYLRKLSTALLSRITRQRDFHCDVMRSLGREILANNVRLSLRLITVLDALINFSHVVQVLGPCMAFVTPYYVNMGLVNGLTKYDPRQLETKIQQLRAVRWSQPLCQL